MGADDYISKPFSPREVCARVRMVLRRAGQLRWRIPTTRPLVMPDVDLPIAPYVLGAWLGDGTSSMSEITCHPDDRATLDRIAALGENVRKRDTAKYAWRLSGPLPDRTRFRQRLRDLNVLNNKHIPAAYLRASVAQRLELLRGLMDTDGFAHRKSVGIDLCNERLASDAAELIRSFGWKVHLRKGPAKLYGVEVGVRYRMHWRTDVNPFHLPRKAALWAPAAAQASRRTVRTITAIEPREPTLERVFLHLTGRELRD